MYPTHRRLSDLAASLDRDTAWVVARLHEANIELLPGPLGPRDGPALFVDELHARRFEAWQRAHQTATSDETRLDAARTAGFPASFARLV